ncbi:tetratricopeptide repeat protein [Trichormus azollae]|uniref:tetratricopeptide repeat protein n=1 Tax=Trichormus azollae TaxID=1164 RepID=UPI00325CAFD0
MLNKLAKLYQSQGYYSEAEPHYAKALQISENVLGAGDPTIMTIRTNYAQCLRCGK